MCLVLLRIRLALCKSCPPTLFGLFGHGGHFTSFFVVRVCYNDGVSLHYWNIIEVAAGFFFGGGDCDFYELGVYELGVYELGVYELGVYERGVLGEYSTEEYY